MDKYLNDETVWGQGSSVWLWPFTSNLASAQWKAIGWQPPHSSQSLLLYVEVWLRQWLMTVSRRKQSTAQVISNPPAPVPRLEENGKEHGQRLDNGKEKGKRMKGEMMKRRRKREGRWWHRVYKEGTYWLQHGENEEKRWEHIHMNLILHSRWKWGCVPYVFKLMKCQLAGSLHVRCEHAACDLSRWLIWQA